MKNSFRSFMMSGAILLGLSMYLTSCGGSLDDLFGEWDKPTTTEVTYIEKAWSGTEVTSTPIVAQYGTYTVMSSSNADVTWPAGTYVVKDNVTIDGDVKLTGDVKLILCDGKELKVNKHIDGDKLYSLSIYAQNEGTGKLTVINNVGYGITDLKNLEIHGGYIHIQSNCTSAIGYSPIKVYGGKLTAKTTGVADGIRPGSTNDMIVYGGEVIATGNGNTYIESGIFIYQGKLAVYGGKVLASNPDNIAIGNTTDVTPVGKFITGPGISYWQSNSGTDGSWGDAQTAPTATDINGTLTMKYVKFEKVNP